MPDIHTLDLEFYGTPHLISSFLAPTDGGFVLFDPGPASASNGLEQQINEVGFELSDLRGVFATHVHLDHAGGAGVLAEWSNCTVFCHPVGAPHLHDPAAKLLPSAERLYGDMMEPLWGTTVGVPKDRLKAVGDGESVTVDGLEVTAWHTPGHAIHHAAWQVGDAVSTGDVAGVRFPGASHVLPPMPPPDIDVEEWLGSLNVLRRIEPDRLLLTHFGAYDDPGRHIDELEDRLQRWTEIARRVVGDGGDKNDLGVELEQLDSKEMAEVGVTGETAERYKRLSPVKESSAGLYRYCSLEGTAKNR
jgi:glyoxylase-like metal-dependent hydrolase (beta-lactamase superfamily II)